VGTLPVREALAGEEALCPTAPPLLRMPPKAEDELLELLEEPE